MSRSMSTSIAQTCAFGLDARRAASVQRVNATREGFFASARLGDRRLVVLLARREPQAAAAEASRHPWLEPMEIPRPTRGRGDAAGAAAFTRPGPLLPPRGGRRAPVRGSLSSPAATCLRPPAAWRRPAIRFARSPPQRLTSISLQPPDKWPIATRHRRRG